MFNEMKETHTKKVMAEVVPTIQPKTKPTMAEEAWKRAGKSKQQNVASSVFGQKAMDNKLES